MAEKRIAIMGAGLSGLSCAFQLEKYGIQPDIFENRSEVEDRFVNGEAMMNLLYHPIIDCLSYLADTFDLHLQPIHPIKRMELLSEKSQATFEGNMGFITVRGRHPQALGKQIAKKVRAKIHFNSKKTYEDLIKEYDTVVLAAGDGAYTRRLQKFWTDVSVKLMGMTIKGHFQPTHVRIFLDNRFAPKGYAFLLPFDEENANLTIATPVDNANMEQLMETLLNEIHFSGKVIDQFQIRDYMIGRPERLRIGNTYFTGNCGGFIMPFLGFGQFGAMLSGLYAAESMVKNLNFEDQMDFLKRSYAYSLRLRRTIEDMDNPAYDRMVKMLRGKIGQRLITSERSDFVKLAARLVLPYTTAKQMIHRDQ